MSLKEIFFNISVKNKMCADHKLSVKLYWFLVKAKEPIFASELRIIF